MESKELLDSFTEHCKNNPTERFWQALLNWSGVGYILACASKDNVRGEYEDTYYWKAKDGKRR